MKYSLISIIIFILFSGCSLLDSETVDPVQSIDSDTKTQLFTGEEVKSQAASYYDEPLTNNVNHYAQWLIQDLFSTMDISQNEEVFMVADLAILDSDLNKTNLFGRQLSEAILHEVHQTGFTTVDIRSTGFIRITEQGNFFSLSRDYLDFDTTVTANNVVTGTLTRHQGGYLLNARVVALDSRMLIGSSQIFVPFEVVDAVMQEGITSNNENNLMNEAENSERGIPLKAYTSN